MNPFDVDTFLATGGLIGLCVLIFIETGLLVGFVFPGDSILFTAGILAAQPDPFAPLWLLCILVPLSAILGDQCGYFIGRRVGRGAVEGRIARFIGPEYVRKTHAYFDRFGALTVFFGRFIGVVRTLTPVVAGFSGMSHRKFTLYSVLGSFAWAAGITVLGYFLGNIPLIRDNIEIFIIASVCTVVVPTFLHLANRWRIARRDRAAAPDGPEPTATDAKGRGAGRADAGGADAEGAGVEGSGADMAPAPEGDAPSR